MKPYISLPLLIILCLVAGNWFDIIIVDETVRWGIPLGLAIGAAFSLGMLTEFD